MGSERGAEVASDGPVAVELDGVSKRYGETTAVDDVSLRVREGEFFTLVGPSGCGKTTTLRLIAGFEEPTSGTVRFAGESVAGVPPEDRDVGVVFQSYALFPHMTVGENVAYGLNFADPPDGVTRDERVAELLELVDLPDAADRDPESLSGGQQQRIAMARALAPGPDVLLLDEPMSALDARLRERLRAQVKRIQSELGITTIYVTHDQEEARAVSDRVAVMNGGTPEQVAPPRTVYREPATRFVAEFVGDNNVFEGRARPVGSAGPSADPDSRAGDRSESPVETRGIGRGSDAGTSGGPGGRADAGGVEVDGTAIPVRTDRRIPPGARVTVCVRPERMTVFEGGSGARDPDAGSVSSRTDESGGTGDAEPSVVLDATVSNAEFLGESTRSYLRWKGRELTVRTADPLAGDVRVGFDAADAHVVAVKPGENTESG